MPRLLVVEDEVKVLRSLADGLRAAGFEVDTAASGDEGVRLAATQPFDCIVLDWMLPGRDGLQVLTELRRREFYEKPTQERKRKKAAAVKRHMKRNSRTPTTRRRRLY